MNREELIAALESAESGSRELSDEVLLALGWIEVMEHSYPSRVPTGSVAFDAAGRGWGYWKDRPSPTESVDDALGLVPEGYWAKVQICRTVGCPQVAHATLEGDADTLGRDMEEWEEYEYQALNCHTPALALSAAILRALPHQDTTEEDR